MTRYAYYIMTFAFVCLLMFSHTDFFNPVSKLGCDTTYYRNAAESPMVWQKEPWSYRIGSPLLACGLAKLTGNLDYSFIMLAFVCLVLTAWVLYAVLRESLEPQYAALGGFLYLGTFWLSRYNLSDPWMCDPLANLVIVSGLYCIKKWWFGWLMVLMTCGAMVKETTLILAVFFYFSSNAWDDEQWWERPLATLMVSGGGILVTLLIRLGAPFLFTGWDSASYYTWDMVLFALNFYNDTDSVWLTFGFLWILAWISAGPRLQRLLLALVLMTVVLRLVDADLPRLVAVAFFYPVIAGACWTLKWALKDWTQPARSYALASVFLMHFFFHYPWGFLSAATEYVMPLSLIPVVLVGVLLTTKQKCGIRREL